jgi:3-hydroxybutyryl-CoA dehydrogenase
VKVDSDALERGKERGFTGLERSRAKGSLTQNTDDSAVAALLWTTSLDNLTACDLVFEAVAESEPIKVDLFKRVDALELGPDVILATTTSSIPVIRIAMATARPTINIFCGCRSVLHHADVVEQVRN